MHAGRRQVCEAWLKLSDSMSPGCWLLDWLLGMAEAERSHVPRLCLGLTYQIRFEFSSSACGFCRAFGSGSMFLALSWLLACLVACSPWSPCLLVGPMH